VTLYVKPSEVHGRGCFTAQLLRPATIFRAPHYDTNEETWTSVTTENGIYELYSPFKFLNHSEDPNAELYQTESGGFELYILREIARDDEITISYGPDWEPP
jgi:SET domain-containing protein